MQLMVYNKAPQKGKRTQVCIKGTTNKQAGLNPTVKDPVPNKIRHVFPMDLLVAQINQGRSGSHS